MIKGVEKQNNKRTSGAGGEDDDVEIVAEVGDVQRRREQSRVLDHETLESLRRQQIERNNDWIDKMSPIVKYKIQEYIRKQKNKKMQRRKFSLACGLRNIGKQEPAQHTVRRRSKKATSDSSGVTRTAKVVVLRGTGSEEGSESTKRVTSSSRRKSTPVQKMDMADLDDLE
uniref:Uncharacterized protein n=1 Tax=Caenorhabditis japonica TaxID=281687 RepID=A0A8R1E499_CAEJA